MGSLSSSAKAPQQAAQVVITQPTTTSVSTEKLTTQSTEDSGVTSAQAREETLLRRNRGRFGTGATSLQGFLSQQVNSGRKTLLGE